MSGTPSDIRRARLDAHRALADLRRTIAEIRHRTSPRTLAQSSWEDVKTRTETVAADAVETVKARPGIAAGVGAAATLFLFRKPLGRLLRRGRDKVSGREEPDAGDERLNDRDISAAPAAE